MVRPRHVNQNTRNIRTTVEADNVIRRILDDFFGMEEKETGMVAIEKNVAEKIKSIDCKYVWRIF